MSISGKMVIQTVLYVPLILAGTYNFALEPIWKYSTIGNI